MSSKSTHSAHTHRDCYENNDLGIGRMNFKLPSTDRTVEAEKNERCKIIYSPNQQSLNSTLNLSIGMHGGKW